MAKAHSKNQFRYVKHRSQYFPKKTQKTCPRQNTVGISKKITIVWEMTACRPWELAPQMFEKTTNELPCQALISKLNLTKEH